MVIIDVVPGQLLKFAAAQTRMKEKKDHIPFIWFAHSEDLLIFLVIEHPHFWRVLVKHLDLQTGIWQIVMFSQPAAKAFQGSQMCVGRSVDIFLQNVVDVTVYVFDIEVGDINRGKFGKTTDDHFIMDLCAMFITPDISEPFGGCLREKRPCLQLQQAIHYLFFSFVE